MTDFKVSDLRTTLQLLELLRMYRKDKGFPDTDYQLAKTLGTATSTINNLLYHGGIMSDETAMQVANELGLPPSYVLLCAWHERNKNEATKEAIKEIADKYLKVSVFILVASVIFNTSSLLYALA
jgi:transcriptional regulator with XRE-family HTH domain